MANKLTQLHRERIADLLENNFDTFKSALARLSDAHFVKAYLELTKYAVPYAKADSGNEHESVDEVHSLVVAQSLKVLP